MKGKTLREKVISQLSRNCTVLRAALVDVVAMLDASQFGAKRVYRCLTEKEQERLKQIRVLNGL
jgi:hypothetical protein